ncbi:TPA: PDZ domain-containing protein [Xanthomonas vasicola pv. zeae]|uniref:PDZ domain-containing protein n=2 Tax=Xanthomonas vasicola TaxID=56459 RepID=A0AAE8F5I7_XANVA|nr:PDZ domain-containing protein [Xanthomonas vasicola pv. vasculorum]TWQ09820.1 PDZ domain-containing protein [Xanthomonas vasicola]HHZ21983.1 PDZ domain-containing protein [Xanthomonas vasicola pv. zeae]AZM70815.1 PDZ domain-containing protein [Xanthomonas vasicola pv. vasculorum]OWF60476.1 serine protease [Xanthomonas vasicola pv. vasculorum]
MNRRTLMQLLLSATWECTAPCRPPMTRLVRPEFRGGSEGLSFNPTLTSVTIDSVKLASPAATAGLQVGDAIVSAQGITVAGSKADVLKQAVNRKVGQTLLFVIVRGAAQPREVTRVAARRPD